MCLFNHTNDWNHVIFFDVNVIHFLKHTTDFGLIETLEALIE